MSERSERDPTILFVKPKAISTRDKKALQAAGVLVIEIEDVANAKLVRAGTELSGGTLLNCAARAIGNGGSFGEGVKLEFSEAICAAITLEYGGAKDKGRRAE